MGFIVTDTSGTYDIVGQYLPGISVLQFGLTEPFAQEVRVVMSFGAQTLADVPIPAGGGNIGSPYPVILAAGDHTFRFQTYDDLGRKVRGSSLTITVKAYTPPQITSFTAKRCLADGTEDIFGTRLKINAAAAIDPVTVGGINKNTPLTKLQYRVYGTDDWTDYTVSGSLFTIALTDQVYSGIIVPAADSYDVRLVAADTWNNTTAQVLAPRAIVPFDAQMIGTEIAVAVGAVADEAGKFMIALPAHFTETPEFDDPAAAVRALGLAPLDASAFPPMVTDYMQNSETGNAFALESQGSGTFERQNPEANHPGIIGVRTSSTANSGGRSKTGLNTFVLGGGEVYEHIFRVVYSSNTTGKYGLHDSYTSAAPANGAWVNVSGTTLTGKTRNASTESTTASSYTITTGTWYHLKIEVNAAATLVTFTLYAENGTLLWTDTLSTNIPTTAGLAACAVATNSGTTARIINDFDWTMFKIDRALTR